MDNNTLDDFTRLIKGQSEDVPILEYRVKDFHSIAGVILTVIDSGFISVLNNVLNLWTQKHFNATVKISYQSSKGEQIEITYSQLTKKDVDEVLSNHPPKIQSKVKLELPPVD